MKLDSIEIYDIGIIGGGIAGAAIARDAALRGLRVVLFEKNTFGSGTSSKSSKLIHGGIRYLELAWKAFKGANVTEAWKNFRFVFVSLRESRILRRIAPSLVEPLGLIIPIYRSDKRNPVMIILGASLYFIMAFFAGSWRPPRFYFGAKAVLKALPELSPEDLLGGVRIWDHWVDDLALVQATVGSAVKNGALCLEHSEVTHYEHDPDSHTYLVRSLDHGKERVWRVRKLINASGPWVDKTLTLGKEKEKEFILPLAGSHLTLKAFLPSSMLLQAQDGRFFFVIIHGEYARVGTTERLVKGPDIAKPSGEEVEYLLQSLRRYFPKMAFSKKEVLSQECGVRPLPVPVLSRVPNEIPREHEIRVSHSGCVHILGVKLTDHRRTAQEVIDRLVPLLLPFNPKIRRKTLTHRLPL